MPGYSRGVTVLSAGELSARQHGDGSFGRQARPEARIVSTIFAARSLQEGGIHEDPGLSRALDFLARTGVVDGGGSIDGRRDAVLSCYTGMLARLLVRAGRLGEAEPLLQWILRYQPVTFGGTTYHKPAGPMWGDYLRRRYGGCMAGTTCVLGLLPTVSALVAARDAGMLLAAEPHLEAMRRLLIDRRVMFGRSGSVMPLAGSTKADPAGTRWLVPAFPLDYVCDLIELVQLARQLGVPQEAMTEAVDLIGSWRLPGGGWPLLGTRRLADVYRPEPVNRQRASEITTRRVAALELAFD